MYTLRRLGIEGKVYVLHRPGIEGKVYVLHRPGIEPGSQPWQGCILPLDHRCLRYSVHSGIQVPPGMLAVCNEWPMPPMHGLRVGGETLP